MSVRALFKAEENFVPVGKLWIFINGLIQFKNNGDGSMERRIVRIPFDQTFANPGEQNWHPGAVAKIPNLAKRLAAEMPGILAWAVEGAKAYYANRGLGQMPDACRMASNEYTAENDLIADFVSDTIEAVDGAFLTAAEAFDAYKNWCSRNSNDPMRIDTFRKKFADRFKDRKGQETGGSRARGFNGLAVCGHTLSDAGIRRRQMWILEFDGNVQARYSVAGPSALPAHLASEVFESAGDNPEVRMVVRTLYGELKRVA